MLGSVVPEAVMEDIELLQKTVDILMPRSGLTFHPLISVLLSSRGVTPAVSISIGTICKEDLIRSKGITHSIPGNTQIRPVTCRIRTIDPNNPASLDADTNFIAETGMVQLVAEPMSSSGQF